MKIENIAEGETWSHQQGYRRKEAGLRDVLTYQPNYKLKLKCDLKLLGIKIQ